MTWLWISAFVGVGCAFAAYAYALGHSRTEGKTRADIAVGIGNAFFAGAGIAAVTFLLQQGVRSQLDRASAEADFLARVNLAANLTGFDPPPVRRPQWRGTACTSRDDIPSEDRRLLDKLAGWSFSAKNLEGARMDGLGLRQASFRDARLVGVTFGCADLSKTNLQRADLSGTDLSGTNLKDADLRGAKLDGATTWAVKSWEGAKVDIQTCWGVEGPWGRQPAAKWLSAHGLRPFTLGRHAASFGHLCDDAAHRVIYVNGLRPGRDVPPAIGKTNIYRQQQWQKEVLIALRALRPVTGGP
jgi:hypothetical protein